MQRTDNYGLNKPEVTEFYDIAKFNENADIIDAKLKELDDDKVNTSDIVDNLESTDDKAPLSAKQGNVLKGSLDTLLTGVNISGGDFNDLGEKSFFGIGSNMANAPIDDATASFLIQHICAGGRVLQFAKAVNWREGELLYYRQYRGTDTSGTPIWNDWYRIANNADVDYLDATLTDLVTNLGTGSVFVEDANAMKKTCFARCNSSSTNVIYQDGMLFTLGVAGNNCCLQINVPFSGNEISYRTYWYGSWKSWYKLVPTA